VDGSVDFDGHGLLGEGPGSGSGGNLKKETTVCTYSEYATGVDLRSVSSSLQGAIVPRECPRNRHRRNAYQARVYFGERPFEGGGGEGQGQYIIVDARAIGNVTGVVYEIVPRMGGLRNIEPDFRTRTSISGASR